MTELELKEASQNPIVPKDFVITGLMEMVRKLTGQSSVGGGGAKLTSRR
jgi:hypothetical protein